MTSPPPDPVLADSSSVEPDLASQLRATEGRLQTLSARVEELELFERGGRGALRRSAFAASLGVGTIVALGLPFLWDDSSRYKEPIAVAGWRLLNYGGLYAFNQPVALFPRLVPWLIVLAGAFTAFVSVLAVRPVLALVAAVVDGALIIASLAGANLVHMTGLKLDSAAKEAIAGPGPGWWVVAVLLVGWAALAVDSWNGRALAERSAGTATLAERSGGTATPAERSGGTATLAERSGGTASPHGRTE